MSDQRTNAVWSEQEPDAVPVTGLDPEGSGRQSRVNPSDLD